MFYVLLNLYHHVLPETIILILLALQLDATEVIVGGVVPVAVVVAAVVVLVVPCTFCRLVN